MAVELAKPIFLSPNVAVSVPNFKQRRGYEKFPPFTSAKNVASLGKFSSAVVGSVISAPISTVDVPRLVDFLYDDLPHVFGDRGIDRTAYDERVQFRDPITKHECLAGYLFNISLLKTLFNPKLHLHWVKQTGQYEISARWTVVMKYNLLPWKPELVLTGISIMGIDPHTAKFCTHVDLWDSIRNNNYFSLEGFCDIFKQMWIDWIYKIPDFGIPKYQILKRMPNYEVRHYIDVQSEEVNGIDLKDRKMKAQNIAAVMNFIGESTDEIVAKNENSLRSSLIADGLRPKNGCFHACYNDSGQTTWSFPVRNEVLIWLEGFKLEY